MGSEPVTGAQLLMSLDCHLIGNSPALLLLLLLLLLLSLFLKFILHYAAPCNASKYGAHFMKGDAGNESTS